MDSTEEYEGEEVSWVVRAKGKRGKCAEVTLTQEREHYCESCHRQLPYQETVVWLS